MNLTKLTIKQTLAGLSSKQFSATEVATEYAKEIKANQRLNCFITETTDLAISLAKKADDAYSSGTAGALEGIPIAVKDLFCTKGIKTTCASKMLADFVPTYESTVTQKLWDAGALMIGKANMDEFAMGSSNTSSFFGPVINPIKSSAPDLAGKDLVPGGSSGGSAAAVAANLCAAALGTDTGGSIRQPASYTKTVGVKPTYGRSSRYGMIAFASSLDQAGVFAKDVYDAALLQRLISGYDRSDSTSVTLEVPQFEKLLNSDVSGKKIGIPKECRINLPKKIEEMWDNGIKMLESRGCKVSEVSLPNIKHSLSVYYIIAPAECSSNLARFDGVKHGYRAPEFTNLEEMYQKTRAQGFGSEVKRRIMVGTYVLSAGAYEAYYKKALQVRSLVLQDFKNAFKQVDALLIPSTPSAAFTIEQANSKRDPVAMYLNDIFTIPASLAGVPAISVPAGTDEAGLPLGLQIIADHFDEQTMFDVALAIESCQKEE